MKVGINDLQLTPAANDALNLIARGDIPSNNKAIAELINIGLVEPVGINLRITPKGKAQLQQQQPFSEPSPRKT